MMVDERDKNRRIARNIAANLVYQAVSIAAGLIIPRLYLTGFGSEINGLIATIKQVFAYLALMETGMSMTASQALYRPVALGQTDKINGILSAVNRYYRRVGLMYGGIVLLFALAYPAVTRVGLPKQTTALIILIYGFPSVLSFCVHGKFQMLIDAEGKSYMLAGFQSALELTVNAVRIVLLLFSDNLVLIQAYYCIGPIARCVFVMGYARKHYPWLNMRAKSDQAAVSQKNAAFVHQAAGMILSNTDAILLSIFCDFKVVSVYAIYQMLLSHIERLITAVSSGATFRLGQMFHTDRQTYTRWHDLYETLYLTGAFTLYTMAALYALPVVRLYTAGIGDANYAEPALPLLFAAANLLSSGRQPAMQTIQFAGRFRQTQRHAVLEAAINAAISVAAAARWGITGCLLGTIAAAAYRVAVSSRYANRRILRRTSRQTLRRWLVNGAVFALLMAVWGGREGEAGGALCLIGRMAATGIAVFAAYAAANFASEWRTFAFLRHAVIFRGRKSGEFISPTDNESHRK
ncbi:MAG: polysaccharide biosynthesis C-terminal domain-containing protein [Clostridia bacterium]|nr:polysaccharide biosynthesis C-terminal domain-containing protein [Clostridia bacterium]